MGMRLYHYTTAYYTKKKPGTCLTRTGQRTTSRWCTRGSPEGEHTQRSRAGSKTRYHRGGSYCECSQAWGRCTQTRHKWDFHWKGLILTHHGWLYSSFCCLDRAGRMPVCVCVCVCVHACVRVCVCVCVKRRSTEMADCHSNTLLGWQLDGYSVAPKSVARPFLFVKGVWLVRVLHTQSRKLQPFCSDTKQKCKMEWLLYTHLSLASRV